MQDRLKHMKETLMCAVEVQLCELGEVDTKELGEAIDMISDASADEKAYLEKKITALAAKIGQMK